jgi:hypothetical protein
MRLSLGENRIGYPRALRIDTSLDGVSWTTVAVRRTAGLALRGVLKDPQTVPIALPIAQTTARFIRMRLEEDQPNVGWVVTDVSVSVTRATDR